MCIFGMSTRSGYGVAGEQLLNTVTLLNAHPSCIDGAVIERLRWPVVVVQGDSIRVRHTPEHLKLGLRYGLGALHVGPKHSLVTTWGCQTALQRC